MKYLSVILFIVVALVIVTLVVPTPTFAQSSTTTQGLQDPLGGRPIQVIIGDMIRIALGIVGSLALLFFIYGGFLYMTAGGSPEKVKKGKDTLVWATTGLAIIFLSYGILSFVFSALKG